MLIRTTDEVTYRAHEYGFEILLNGKKIHQEKMYSTCYLQYEYQRQFRLLRTKAAAKKWMKQNLARGVKYA